jgi:hypothetical protein
MKTNITALAITASAVFASTGLQAGEPVEAPPMSPSVADCPWGLGLEAMLLKAHSNEGIYDEQDEEFAYRVALSYKAGDNLGFRLRYFDFEGSGDEHPEMTAFDAEVFDSFTLGSWNGEFSLGLRFASFEETDDLTDFNGFGPVLGLELTRTITGPLSFYANARTGLIFGEDDENEDDSFLATTELGLGLQYTFTMMGSCESYVRLGVEAQNWASISDNDNEDTGLFGGVLKVGFSF